jgi:hypothetical protein
MPDRKRSSHAMVAQDISPFWWRSALQAPAMRRKRLKGRKIAAQRRYRMMSRSFFDESNDKFFRRNSQPAVLNP